QNCAGIAIRSVERIRPRDGKVVRRNGRTNTVKRVVEVFRAVAGGLDYDHALGRRILDGLKIILPPLDGNVAELIQPHLEVVAQPRTVQLDVNDIASA